MHMVGTIVGILMVILSTYMLINHRGYDIFGKVVLTLASMLLFVGLLVSISGGTFFSIVNIYTEVSKLFLGFLQFMAGFWLLTRDRRKTGLDYLKVLQATILIAMGSMITGTTLPFLYKLI